MDDEAEFVDDGSRSASWSGQSPAEGAIEAVEAVEAGLRMESPSRMKPEPRSMKPMSRMKRTWYPGGFETQVLEGAAPWGSRTWPLRMRRTREASRRMISRGTMGGQKRPLLIQAPPRSPGAQWLFSLLKKEEEKRGGEVKV